MMIDLVEMIRMLDLLARAHAEAFKRYRHAPVVMGIDVYHLEAEAAGAVIMDAGGETVPKLAVHPCESAGRRVKGLHPEADVRIPGPWFPFRLRLHFAHAQVHGHGSRLFARGFQEDGLAGRRRVQERLHRVEHVSRQFPAGAMGAAG
jgi:hypothetical protein